MLHSVLIFDKEAFSPGAFALSENTNTANLFLLGHRPSFIHEVGMRNARLSAAFAWLLGRQVHLHLNVSAGIHSTPLPEWKSTGLINTRSWGTELKRLVYDKVVQSGQSNEKDKQFVTSGFGSLTSATTVKALPPVTTWDCQQTQLILFLVKHPFVVLLIHIKSVDWTPTTVILLDPVRTRSWRSRVRTPTHTFREILSQTTCSL